MPSILSSQKNIPEHSVVLVYEQMVEMKIVEEIHNMSHITKQFKIYDSFYTYW